MPKAKDEESTSDAHLVATAIVGQFIWRAGDPQARLSDHLLAETAVAVLQAALCRFRCDRQIGDGQALWSRALDDLASLETVQTLVRTHGSSFDSGIIRSRSKTIGKIVYVAKRSREIRKGPKRPARS